MQAHFKFAWIHHPDASAAMLPYDDVYCTGAAIVLSHHQKNNDALIVLSAS